MANDETLNNLETSMDSDLPQIENEYSALQLDFDALERTLDIVKRSSFLGDSASAVHITQEMLKALKIAVIERLKSYEEK